MLQTGRSENKGKEAGILSNLDESDTSHGSATPG